LEDSVRHELEKLLGYAQGVGRAAQQFPDRADIVIGGRGYIGGALTTLHHLGLVSWKEHQEWWARLMDELPPTNWITIKGP
jgi:hypothetical protein